MCFCDLWNEFLNIYDSRPENKLLMHVCCVLYFQIQSRPLTFDRTAILPPFHVVLIISEALLQSETSCCIPYRYQSLSCVITHRVTTVFTSQSSLNLCPPRFCFSVINRWQSLGDHLPWYKHDHCRQSAFETWWHTVTHRRGSEGKLANGVGSQYSDTTSEGGVSSIATADAHTAAASSRLNW